MFKLFIIANESEQVRKLSSGLARRGLDCSVAPYSAKIIEQIVKQSPDAVLVDMDSSPIGSEVWELPQRIKQERHMSVIALVSREALDSLNSNVSIDDFIVKPWNTAEVIARVKRILWQVNNVDSKEVIKCGDLVIDLAKYQVSLGGKLIILTFKEYQLLKFLASNKEKVFTREALLNKVWGWDYFGGDRTVDVHIRRLRSKIEDRNHSFIETIRSIGYRFKENT